MPCGHHSVTGMCRREKLTTNTTITKLYQSIFPEIAAQLGFICGVDRTGLFVTAKTYAQKLREGAVPCLPGGEVTCGKLMKCMPPQLGQTFALLLYHRSYCISVNKIYRCCTVWFHQFSMKFGCILLSSNMTEIKVTSIAIAKNR